MRAPRPDSKWRIITPLLLLTLLTQSFVLAYACATDQGPWSPVGYLGPGRFTTTLVLLSPLVIWGASWLWAWEGAYDILEHRIVVGLISGVACLAVCTHYAFSLAGAELQNFPSPG